MILNPVFGNGCIFQANKPVRVFGSGAGEVTVSMNGCSAGGVFEGEAWLLELPAMEYGGPYEMDIDLNGEKKTLTDVYIGDVLFAGGQSNMEMKLDETAYDLSRIADDPLLRVYETDKPSGDYFSEKDGWVKAKAETAAHFSAVGYMTARKLREETGHAVGVIACYQGAAAIQTFLPESVFADEGLVVPENERHDMNYPWNPGTSVLYHSMLEGIAPYSVGTVIYYQGESNTSDKESRIYGRLLSKLIETWRELFRDETLRFIIIQIADYLLGNREAWTRVQQAQAQADAWENVDTVICRDICERDLIHPLHKEELAMRVAEKLLKEAK